MKSGRFLVMVSISLLAACAAVVPKGSPADRDPLRRAVVEDVADGMSHVFDASGTTLTPARAMTGAFDVALLAALRGKGFHVDDQPARGVAFDCRVDSMEGSIYRVSVRVGETELSRLWVLDGTAAYAGGAWVRRQ